MCHKNQPAEHRNEQIVQEQSPWLRRHRWMKPSPKFPRSQSTPSRFPERFKIGFRMMLEQVGMWPAFGVEQFSPFEWVATFRTAFFGESEEVVFAHRTVDFGRVVIPVGGAIGI